MAVCKDCNVNMIENINLRGQHPFEIGVDGRSNILLDVPTGQRKTNFLGMTYDEEITYKLSARMCPNCRKVELYAKEKE